MYNFPEHVVEAALLHYTIHHCGEYDELFLLRVYADTIKRPALEACIVMDYLDEKFKALYQSSQKQFDQHFQTSSNRNGLAS